MKSDLPKPDIKSKPSYVSETVCEIIFSDSNERRAIITIDDQGHYRVHTDFWCLSDYDYIGKGYWAQDDRFVTITDALDKARKIAEEELHLKNMN